MKKTKHAFTSASFQWVMCSFCAVDIAPGFKCKPVEYDSIFRKIVTLSILYNTGISFYIPGAQSVAFEMRPEPMFSSLSVLFLLESPVTRRFAPFIFSPPA